MKNFTDNPANIGTTGSETGLGSPRSNLTGYAGRLLKNLTSLRTSDNSLCDVELVPGLSDQVGSDFLSKGWGNKTVFFQLKKNSWNWISSFLPNKNSLFGLDFWPRSCMTVSYCQLMYSLKNQFQLFYLSFSLNPHEHRLIVFIYIFPFFEK